MAPPKPPLNEDDPEDALREDNEAIGLLPDGELNVIENEDDPPSDSEDDAYLEKHKND